MYNYSYILYCNFLLSKFNFINTTFCSNAIYVFILKEMLHILPVWKDNKEGDYSKIVDSPEIFEFINCIREEDKRWCQEFETAQNIISALKMQLSYLFKESLDIRTRVKESNLPTFWNNLSSKAINILLEKDAFYELQFYQQVLEDELKIYEDLFNDFEYSILLRSTNIIFDLNHLINWLNAQIVSLKNMVNSSTRLMNEIFPKFYGKPGEASDLKGLYYVAKSISKIFKEMIEWSVDVQSTVVDEKAEKLKECLSRFCNSTIRKIWNFPKLLENNLKNTKKGRGWF
jgi:hypothetical protein